MENIVSNCGTPSAFFSLLVVAAGVLVFGIYVAKQRRQPPAQPEDQETENVGVDREGWETKGSEDEEGWETNPES
jgi:hypothetical protein